MRLLIIPICLTRLRRSISDLLAMNAASRSKPVFSSRSVNWCCVIRYASRMSRLQRFLTTAFPSLLLAINATRVEPVPDGRRIYFKSMSLPRRNIPALKRLVKAFLPLRMTARGSLSRRIVTLLSILLWSSLIADRQAMTAFDTATTKYLPSICGFHARTESVRIGALALTWLVRAFHFDLKWTVYLNL